nr:immunoglobulin light chain junction region [Macaca mulatta]MOW29467.1 immunoglobulin light chain junction region [Macaca mulatta]MOW30083.1 immunoglobulin light chain junction region [Macaca mulatta]MOW30148.1 immunoglobulin light chain junction region [Macaca mulatta]MOW30722.1 immunoglobulin light chain junction region [Macaca mulatta]
DYHCQSADSSGNQWIF